MEGSRDRPLSDREGGSILIEFQRAGGFAGTTLKSAIDTGDLPAEEAREIEDLVKSLDLDQLAKSPRAPSGPDRFEYTVAIGDGDATSRFTVSEPDAGPDVKRLVARLTAIARERRSGS